MGNTCISAPLHCAAKPSHPSATGFPDGGGVAGTTSKKSGIESIEQRQHREREAGQRQLRDMVAAADASGVALDWSALIKKAEELHRRDQEYEHKRRRMLAMGRGGRWGRGKGGGDGSGGGVSSRLQQNLERRRRRRADACGSFSVNLTTYRNETEEPLLRSDRPSSDKDGGTQATSASEEIGSDLTGSSSGALDNRSTITSSTVPGIDEECCSRSFDSGGAGSLGLSENGMHTYGSTIGEEALETIHE